MSIKRILATASLILPIAITFIPFQADAQIRRPVRRSVPARIIRRPLRVLTFPVKSLLQAANLHKGHAILTSLATVPGYQ
ncbi:hypothetical protein, partial [Nostoc sp.]|uniref:hypothetical protein n=1 Tax=Nostoc sp. TaxID=1180 RepID=UPI002FF92BE1